MVPQALFETLTSTLGAPVHTVERLGGGAISDVARVGIGRERYVVKWFAEAPKTPAGWPQPFAAEAYALEQIAATNTVRVPHVVAQAGAQDSCPPYIVLEWIKEHTQANPRAAGEMLGQQLAALHRITAPAYGWEQHNYIGLAPQLNTWTTSWTQFWAEQRLGAQMNLLQQAGRLSPTRAQRLEALIQRLPAWIDNRVVQPSLLHGDLWGGNWLIDINNEPVLIDPAAYYGDREAELAMCHLFGGFPSRFFHAYDDAWPPAPGRDERIPLYQLYHLLNHLLGFGESYGAQVDAVLRRYGT
jgi:fructosamine-3-kinase